MIITKSWLSDWLDIEDRTLDDLARTFNCIGIEVNRICELKVADNIVVGFIKDKVKHKNSHKLSICQVDIGDKVVQIVCGAENVDLGQFVALALEGAIMPNGMQIKCSNIRGISSHGMLCSSVELGFEKINDGIMLLDESIGKLELGRALNSYDIFNDGLIEVELTPNRGDCLSIYGIARDLATALNVNLKERPPFKDSENVLGIGRILRLAAEKELNSIYNYRAIELKGEIQSNLLIDLRLAQIQNFGKNVIENLLNYVTHSTGVLFNAYDLEDFSKENEEFTLNLSKEIYGETKILCQNECLSISGIYQNENFKCSEDSKIVIIEASYTDPMVIAEARTKYKKQDEKIIYRSFRGSEPRLTLGMDYLLNILEKIPNILIYSSSQQVVRNKELPAIAVNLESMNNIIGQNIDKDEILKILKKLGFELILSSDGLVNVKTPMYRPDIKNLADICEEIVRIIGIDSIVSKNLSFVEKNRFNSTYKNYKELVCLRKKAVANGYFESLHYILDSEEELKALGFHTLNLKLINPISAELNTLRTTLLNHLLNAVSLNAKNSKKIIKLFELGLVFQNNDEETNRIAFVHSGYKEEPKISNKAKPSLVNFYDFLLDLKNIIGEFKLKPSKHRILSPYEQVDIYLKDIRIGFAGRLHLRIENERNLLKTYICELDLNWIRYNYKLAKIYSKFPSISRDLSILIPKGFEYERIKNCIGQLHLQNLETFRLIDLYSDDSLKNFYSLTIKFIFRDMDKTLEEDEVAQYMRKIIEALEQLGLHLR